MRDKAVLVETTILVDYLRGSDAAAEYLDKARAEGDVLCSTVTQAELIVRSRNRGEIRGNRSAPCPLPEGVGSPFTVHETARTVCCFCRIELPKAGFVSLY